MNRIDNKFKELKDRKKKAFVAYIAAGDPDIETSAEIARSLAHNGVDILELGIPFSDPLADGPTIQKALERSLRSGCNVRKVMGMVKTLRKDVDIPIVYMTYYNIVYNYGIERFARDSFSSGVDGLIVPDLPLEEADMMANVLKQRGLCPIMLAAPTTPCDRFKKIASMSGGFVYYVSLTGVTGAREDMARGMERKIKTLKSFTDRPVCVGFGISNPDQAKKAANFADGVIVGSAIVGLIEKNLNDKKGLLEKIARSVRSFSGSVHG